MVNTDASERYSINLEIPDGEILIGEGGMGFNIDILDGLTMAAT